MKNLSQSKQTRRQSSREKLPPTERKTWKMKIVFLCEKPKTFFVCRGYFGNWWRHKQQKTCISDPNARFCERKKINRWEVNVKIVGWGTVLEFRRDAWKILRRPLLCLKRAFAVRWSWGALVSNYQRRPEAIKMTMKSKNEVLQLLTPNTPFSFLHTTP